MTKIASNSFIASLGASVVANSYCPPKRVIVNNYGLTVNGIYSDTQLVKEGDIQYSNPIRYYTIVNNTSVTANVQASDDSSWLDVNISAGGEESIEVDTDYFTKLLFYVRGTSNYEVSFTYDGSPVSFQSGSASYLEVDLDNYPYVDDVISINQLISNVNVDLIVSYDGSLIKVTSNRVLPKGISLECNVTWYDTYSGRHTELILIDPNGYDSEWDKDVSYDVQRISHAFVEPTSANVGSTNYYFTARWEA